MIGQKITFLTNQAILTDRTLCGRQEVLLKWLGSLKTSWLRHSVALSSSKDFSNINRMIDDGKCRVIIETMYSTL